MNSSKRLSREDWDQLDTLIGKHGFGGYYDFLECLRMVGKNIAAGLLKEDGDVRMIDLDEVKTLHEMTSILLSWSDKISVWRGNHPDWEEEVYL